MSMHKKIWAGALIALTAFVAVPRDADAAAYFSAASWYGAVSDMATERGSVTLTPLQGYEVSYTDWYGSWTKATQNDKFAVGPEIGYYAPADGLMDRSSVYWAKGVTPGSLGTGFSCHSAWSRCVGVMSVTFTLPYEIIGLSGMLDIGADWWPSTNIMPELEASSVLAGFDWKINSPDTFYGKMFALPTNTFTVNWNVGGYGSDNFSGFNISDVMLLRAPSSLVDTTQPTSVPEPASLALFGVGVAGLLAARRRSRKG